MEKEINHITSTLKKDLENEKTKYFGHIFHYTSTKGLKGILETGKIWFSNSKFLNDSSENNYIYTLFPKTPKIRSEKVLDEDFFKLITNIANSYIINYYCDIDNNRWWTDHVYVASFSKDKDNLGLWNYYTKNQNAVGYNLGFTTMPFDNINSKYFKFIHGEVIYEPEIQINLIINILLKYNDLYVKYKDKLINDCEEKQFFIKTFIDILELHNIFFKPIAYSEENEYRCAVYNIKNHMPITPQIRITNDLLLPYYEIEFERTLFDSIRISPTSNPILHKQNLEIFCILNRYKNINIYPSNIPKRY